MLFEALNTARDLGRLHEIASVLLRHGLGDVVSRMGIASALERAGRAIHIVSGERTKHTTEERFRQALEDLGPTFVKIGQILATRSDLLPPSWTRELETLQEDAQEVPWTDVEAQLVEDLGGPVEEAFREVEREPLAAASIAQVHVARLFDGTEVVLKVRRPGIEDVVEADLRLLARLADTLERNVPELRRYRPKALARQMSHSLRRELDFACEARTAQRIADHLAELEGVVVPRIHERWTCRRLCVMDRLHGPSVGEWLREGEPDRGMASRIARLGADAVLRMVFVDGLYHADPHPGNVLVLGDTRVGLLDFGMVGHLSESRRLEFLELLMAIVEQRDEDMADILLLWSHDGDPDVAQLTHDCAAFAGRYEGVSLAKLDATALLTDISTLLRDNDLFLPQDVAMLLKVFVTLEGFGRQLDPQFVVSEQIEPFAREALRANRSPFRVMRRNVGEVARLLRTLPRDVRRLVQSARAGRFKLDIGLEDLERFGHQIDQSANRVTMGLVTAALIIGTSIALTVSGEPQLFGMPFFALLGFGSSVAMGLFLLWSIARSRRR